MAYAIVAGLAFLAGAASTFGLYNREITIAHKLQAAWGKGSAAFDREVSAVEAEFHKLFGLK